MEIIAKHEGRPLLAGVDSIRLAKVNHIGKLFDTGGRSTNFNPTVMGRIRT